MPTPTLPPLPEPDSYCTFKDSHDYDVFSAEQMHSYATTYGQACADAARAELLAEVERWRGLFRRMREIAAGYSNCCDESGTTRRLERDFDAVEADARAAIDSANQGESK